MMNSLKVSAFAPLLVTTSAFAQDRSDVVEAAKEAAEAAAAAAEYATPAPAPLPPRDYSSPPAIVDFESLELRATDYPEASWAAGEEGGVGYELAVDEDGNVTNCTVTESSGFEALDARTCEIAMERAQLYPARDKDGVAIAGTHKDYQSWTIREPNFPGTATIHVEFTVNEIGETIDCDVIEVSGMLSESMRRSFEREPCPGVNRPSRAVYRDENGVPIAKRVSLKVEVETETVE